MHQKLDTIIDGMQTEIIKAVQENVRIKSTEGISEEGMPFGEGPAKALDHALKLAEKLHFGKVVNIKNKIGYAEYGNGREMIAVLGHLDVVEAGEGWSYPPYGGEIHDGSIWGRGTLDDKGPSIGALFALKAIQKSGATLSRRIRVILGTNEESGSKDVACYNETEESPIMGFTPDAGYPVIFAEKGILNLLLFKEFDQSGGSVKLLHLSGGTASNIVPDEAEALLLFSNGEIRKLTGKGSAAHGSTPEMGENAIIDLLTQLSSIDFCRDLKEWITFMLMRIGEETTGDSLQIHKQDLKFGDLTVNLATMNYDNSSDRIEARINIRYPFSSSSEEIKKAICDTACASGIHVLEVSHKKPLYVSENSELVKRLQYIYEKKTGIQAKPIAIGGGTYAKAIPNTVAFGPIFPGQEDVTHQADEHISIENLMKNIKIMAAAMYELAKQE